MQKSVLVRLIIIAIVLILFVVYAIPTFVKNKDSLPSFFPEKVVHLGLDLKGGMHLVLGVDTEKAVETIVERAARQLRIQLDKEKIAYDEVTSKKAEISISLIDPLDNGKLLELIDRNYPHYTIVKETLPIVIKLDKKAVAKIHTDVVEQALSIIRNRVDQFGVAEPTILKYGKDNIIVELPGIKNPARAVRLIGKMARLELKLVDEKADITEALQGNLPEDDELLYQIKRDPYTGEAENIPMVVKRDTIISGEMLKSARVSFGQTLNQPHVTFDLNSEGAGIFAQFTGSHVGKKLAIVLDNIIYSAPVIQERIGGGTGQITGSFTTKEAHDLAIVLRSGSLPAPVNVLENITIGPSLGKDSIKKGAMSAFAGAILVVLFMIFYYRASGFLADFVLTLNIIIIFGALAMFGATLTLPGLAGIALTIGMSVDANVLIFERIREELRIGRTIHDAINTGYKRATLTILDANITTLITTLVLYQFGTGPIRGFAVTLSIGIIANMFTAIVVTKLVYDIVLMKFSPKKLSI
ncbi:MAG: protein translocase subunit SecD [Campylobacterota bacterium]|nr:protein translocase subunit SecD [Campylobacterota bacterium]